jgi:hypothetical protein
MGKLKPKEETSYAVSISAYTAWNVEGHGRKL